MRTVRPKSDPHPPMHFENALHQLPAFLIGGYDPLQHKAVDDLIFLAQLQIDLYREGDQSDIANQRDYKAALEFIQKMKGVK